MEANFTSTTRSDESTNLIPPIAAHVSPVRVAVRQGISTRSNQCPDGLIIEIVPRPSMIADSRGMAMWWLNKDKRREIWDEEIQWPIGDIEAAHRIRGICRSAADSAEKVGGLAGPPDSKKDKRETERYERAAKAAMEVAIRISDDLMRDSAVRQIVDLCMKASDLRTARILLRAIQAVSISQDVLNDHPALRQ